jgi:tRNA threonylcarbamoyladenosine biosynthesis protein TsaB
MPGTTRLLAIETSTDTLSVALGSGAPGSAMWQHSGPGAAQASATLLPLVRDLLDQAGWSLASLDAVVFGRGPGSFTGLRTACAVAQGLAYGARQGGIPVLPMDTLLALAEEARHDLEQRGSLVPGTIVALLDARMSEVYVAPYTCGADGLRALAPARLCAPIDLATYLNSVLPTDATPLLAGNALQAYPDILAGVRGFHASALPTATALLRLAPRLLASGGAVTAQDALPLYVRDKVAKTTAEREGQGTTLRSAEATP